MFLSNFVVVYLQLMAGLSRRHANLLTTLTTQGIMLQNFAAVIGHRDARKRAQDLPRNVRTAVSWLDLNPVLYRSACCPACFQLYPMDHIPKHCEHQITIRSAPRGASLLRRPGVSHRIYNTQSLKAFLERLLKREGIEEATVTYQKNAQRSPILRDVYHGRLWQNFKGS